MPGIEGLDELILKIDKLEDELSLDEPLQEACAVVEAAAKEKCPVDDGTLRASISSMVVGNVGYVGTNVEYAPYVEYGTGIYAVKGDGRKTPWVYCDDKGNFHYTVGQHPQPYLEPALMENASVIREIFRSHIGEALR